MLELNKALKYLDYFSLITVSSDKVPNFSWKEQQTEKLSTEKFSKYYTYKGGLLKKDSSEIKPTENFGIVTGFEDLEVIDVDLKVFSTAKEQREFWDEFYSLLQDNILDFDEKFVVYKTKNAGYHILYKSKRVQGNLKIAKLKGHDQAIIETRGKGGYVFTYPDNKVTKNSYFNIQYISDLDHEILFDICKMYDYKEEPAITKDEVKRVTNNEYTEDGVTPWEDYNNKVSILDIISEEFSIDSKPKKFHMIKRHGATSAHSGYIYKDSGCMFLFSTGTIYPHEKLITPFIAYTYKYHNGDFKAAASDLYKKGYGSRLKKTIKEIEKKIVIDESLLEEFKIKQTPVTFPIDIFPENLQQYILECNDKLDSNLDFMGVSLMWLASIAIGNSFEIEVKKGWNENATLWIAVVGKAGLGKTPSVNNIIYPLQKINSKEIKKYLIEYEKYEYYEKLPKKERDEYPEVKKPKKKQFIANDITIEALVDLHQECDNGVAVFKDELAGWFKDMNKYRQGSDLEFWLSTWSGKSVNLNRLTRAGSFVEKPFIPVLGGIQPDILNSFFTEDNKDNGFIDRILLSFPEAEIDYYNDNELDENLINWYSESIVSFYENLKIISDESRVNSDDFSIVPTICKFDDEAKIEWKRIFNKITDIQNSDNENEYIKSMYPKQKTYIPRFALILSILNDFFNGKDLNLHISKESILKAEKLSNYFIENAKNIKIRSNEIFDIKKVIDKKDNITEKVISAYENDKDFNRTKLAEMLGISVQHVRRIVKKVEHK